METEKDMNDKNAHRNSLVVATDVLSTGPIASDSAELFKMIGRHEAFGAIANRTTAVWAECLKRIKESKQYKALGITWDEFCPAYLSISTDTADRIIKNLNEFGEIYFLLSEVTKISRDQFQAIQGHITDGKLRIGEELVDIAKSNQDRIRDFISSVQMDAQIAKSELAKSKEAETKSRKAAETAKKAYESAREELVELKSQDDKLFPNVSDAMKQLLKAQTLFIRGAEILSTLAATPLSEVDDGALKGLAHYAISVITTASGEDPAGMFSDMLSPRDLLSEQVPAVKQSKAKK
jgi:hypothetical protein